MRILSLRFVRFQDFHWIVLGTPWENILRMDWNWKSENVICCCLTDWRKKEIRWYDSQFYYILYLINELNLITIILTNNESGFMLGICFIRLFRSDASGHHINVFHKLIISWSFTAASFAYACRAPVYMFFVRSCRCRGGSVLHASVNTKFLEIYWSQVISYVPFIATAFMFTMSD